MKLLDWFLKAAMCLVVLTAICLVYRVGYHFYVLNTCKNPVALRYEHRPYGVGFIQVAVQYCPKEAE